MRIWLTGIGVVSPLGNGAARTMDRLLAGDVAFGPVTLFDTSGCRNDVAAEVAGLRVADVAPRSDAETWSRTDAMAVVAAREALDQAGLDAGATVDLVVGTTTAGMYETEDLLADLARDPAALAALELERDGRRSQPGASGPATHGSLRRMLSHPLSAIADRMRQAVRPFRRARTLCSACSSGANALLLGAEWLRAGTAERVLAGGADGLCRLTFAGFSSLGAMSRTRCRPFDAQRDGLTLGEGAAFLLLETEAAARARGASPIAELRGWALGSEAHHITNPEQSGATAARLMQEALAVGGLSPGDIDYVNAHGTATPLNDVMEAAALRRCLGAEVARVRVSSSKGQIGHTLGAAGAVEAAITALAIQRGMAPPTAGLEQPDPACDLHHVTEATPLPIRAALSSSFGFGGTDTVLLLTAPGSTPEPPVRPSRRVFVTAAATVGPLGVQASGQNARYTEAAPLAAEAVPFEPGDHLDLERARRIDRAGRLAAAAIGAALGAAGLPLADGGSGDEAPDTGAVMGGAFGSVDLCAAYVLRIHDKGNRYASPAVFPNLVPSSPVAHASIYHRFGGPVFAGADLAATSESNIVTAVELLRAGLGTRLAAGGVEQHSPITERVLAPLCNEPTHHEGSGAGTPPRGEGTAILLLESDAALADGRRPIAEVVATASWRGDPLDPLAAFPPPTEAAVVVVASFDAAVEPALAGSPWSGVPRRETAQRTGSHEAAGGFAAAAAAALLATGQARQALILGLAPDRGYAILLEASPS